MQGFGSAERRFKMKTENLIIRVSEQLKQQAEELATSKQMSVSEYLRYLIQREVDNCDSKI